MNYTEEDKKIMACLDKLEAEWYLKLRESGMSSEDAQLLARFKVEMERERGLVECVQEGNTWDSVKSFISAKFKK